MSLLSLTADHVHNYPPNGAHKSTADLLSACSCGGTLPPLSLSFTLSLSLSFSLSLLHSSPSLSLSLSPSFFHSLPLSHFLSLSLPPSRTLCVYVPFSP